MIKLPKGFQLALSLWKTHWLLVEPPTLREATLIRLINDNLSVCAAVCSQNAEMSHVFGLSFREKSAVQKR